MYRKALGLFDPYIPCCHYLAIAIAPRRGLRKRRSSTLNRAPTKLTINIPTTSSKARPRLVLSTPDPSKTPRPSAKKLILKGPKLIEPNLDN